MSFQLNYFNVVFRSIYVFNAHYAKNFSHAKPKFCFKLYIHFYMPRKRYFAQLDLKNINPLFQYAYGYPLSVQESSSITQNIDSHHINRV